jgi:hypothetical protein
MLFAVCCMTALASFPSRHIRVKNVLLVTDRRRLRTINDHRDLVVNASYPIIDASHSIFDVVYLILDSPHSIVDSMCGLQSLRSGHPSLLVCQLV